MISASIKESAFAAAVGIVAVETIPVSGEEGIWLWRGFVTLSVTLSGLYIRSLHKKIEACSTVPDVIEMQQRHLRAIVRIMAVEAEMHGEKRASDQLVLALREEMEEDLKRRTQ